MVRFIESFPELVSKDYFLSFKRWKFNQRWFVLSIGGLMQGMEQITSFSDGWGYFAHFFICMKSHHSWILARRPTSSWCDPLQWEGISYDSPSPPSRTKVQFRRNLNWQFEVDYFGTWNIHFSTISVKNRRTAGIIASVFSRKPLEFIQIRKFVFSHVSFSLISSAQGSDGPHYWKVSQIVEMVQLTGEDCWQCRLVIWWMS